MLTAIAATITLSGKSAIGNYQLSEKNNGCVITPKNAQIVRHTDSTFSLETQSLNSMPMQKVAEDEMVNIAFHVDFDPNEYDYLNMVTYLNSEIAGCFYPEEWFDPDARDVFGKLPKGTYDFTVELWRKSENGGGLAKIFKELVTIDKDTEITFNASDVKHHVAMHSILPNGEVCVLPTKQYIDQDPWIETTDPGNVNNILCFQFYVNDEWGTSSALSGSGDFINASSGVDGERRFDFYFNELSDRYTLVQVRLIPFEGGFLLIKCSSKDFDATAIYNDPSKFITYQEEFALTPGREQFKNGDVNSYLYLQPVVGKGKVQIVMSGTSKEMNPIVYMDCPMEDMSISGAVNAYLGLSRNDINTTEIVHDDYWGDEVVEIFARTTSLPVLQNDNKIMYANIGHQDTQASTLRIPEDYPFVQLTYNSAFSYMQEYKKGIIANNTPILSVLDNSQLTNEGVQRTSSNFYIGRFGETRQTDLLFMESTLDYNGTRVASTTDEVYEWTSTIHPAGNIQQCLVNRNIIIDGEIPAENMTEIIIDETSGDIYAPTLQMLQTCDGDFITDRFNRIEDVTIEFCAGDFTPIIDQIDYGIKTYTRQWYSCDEVSAKLECKATSDDTFIEVPVTIDENLFMPAGFGYFYCADLKNIDLNPYKGWYDLRITLTDKAGNIQRQTLAPALYIADSNSVENVTSVCNNIVIGNNCITINGAEIIEIYNMTGVKVKTVFSENISTSELNSGIYIVKGRTPQSECISKFSIK
ncbi:MAG: T9SS type A sorting domain-containing protein [Bacteroides sp.]|nr:T9SS type A sorting domain-containing protein [Bacteroides sp.]